MSATNSATSGQLEEWRLTALGALGALGGVVQQTLSTLLVEPALKATELEPPHVNHAAWPNAG
ncbi:MAG: hypothetical protein ABIT38_17385 [Gemmatimonadaceae bacterium]